MGVNQPEFLDMLRGAARGSNCSKIHFGAAALDYRGRVMATGCNHIPPNADVGWNGFTRVRCADDCVGGIRRGVASGTCLERCFAVHAEQDALLRALPSGAVHGIAVAGWLPDGTQFDNGGGFYCTMCARLMAAANVRTVYIWQRDPSGVFVCVPKRISEAWADSYRVISAVV